LPCYRFGGFVFFANIYSLHQETRRASKDVSGGPLPIQNEKLSFSEKDGFVTADGDEPTEEEKTSLVHVPETLPWSAWLVAIIEFCERFTYYGVSGIFQNYIQQPYDRSNGVPGALDMGHQSATALSTFFQFWYVLQLFQILLPDI
jgi:proton-dependent oligopeptide transporter, POT family